MNSLKQLLFFIDGFVAYLLDRLLVIFPRDKNKWIYGASGGFRDNPKYFFFQTTKKHPEINSIWIGHIKKDVLYLQSRGFKAYYWLSIRGLYHTLTAGVAICDHSLKNINNYLLGGVYYVNLWHGSSVKRVRWQNPSLYVKKFNLNSKDDMRSSFTFRMKLYQILFKGPDFCLVPSTIQAKDFFAPMMDIPLNHCVVGVFPRSQLLVEGKQAASDFICKYEPKETRNFVEKLKKYNKSYIYMPTWRDGKADFMSQSGIDWNLLNSCLQKRNELFILKFHPYTKINIDSVSAFSNLMIYPRKSDVYTVLPFIDCLITDYSSIYTDFLIMNKEIILFVFDYDEYVKNSNDLGDYDKYFLGKRANDFTQLLDILDSNEDCHVPKEQYNFLMNYFWDNNNYKIDIVEEIKKRIFI